MPRTFMDRYLAGEVTVDAIDDCVDAWHHSDTSLVLHEYLGFTREEWGMWLLDASALPRIRDARQAKEG